MPEVPLYEESSYPSLPGLFMRTGQLDAVVRVRNWHPNPAGPGSFSGAGGTGVLIGPRLVLTAKHVTTVHTRERSTAVPASSLDVVFGADFNTPTAVFPVRAQEIINPGVALAVGGLRRDVPLVTMLSLEHADLALLLIDAGAPANYIPIGTEPIIGQNLQLSGFGQMALPDWSRGWAIGTVSHLVHDRSGFFARVSGSAEADTAPGPGDSGGPAIAASPGGSAEIVGIVSGGSWMFAELQRTRMETYVSVYHYRDWIRAASDRLLSGEWVHERIVGKAARRSYAVPLIIGGVLLLGVMLLVGKSR